MPAVHVKAHTRDGVHVKAHVRNVSGKIADIFDAPDHGMKRPSRPRKPKPPATLDDLTQGWVRRAEAALRENPDTPEWAHSRPRDFAHGRWGLFTDALAELIGPELADEARKMQAEMPKKMSNTLNKAHYERRLKRHEQAMRDHRKKVFLWRQKTHGSGLTGMDADVDFGADGGEPRFDFDTHLDQKAAVAGRLFGLHPLDKNQTAAVKHYSDSGEFFNHPLREQYKDPEGRSVNYWSGSEDEIRDLDSALRPAQESVVVFRRTTPHEFGVAANSIDQNIAGMLELVGTVHTQPGYLSTTIDEVQTKGSLGVSMRLKVPAGVPGIWMEDDYTMYPGELELLLARGLRIFVHDVTLDDDPDHFGYASVTVDAEVILPEIPDAMLAAEVHHHAQAS